MARVSDKWILDLEVKPTDARSVSAAQVEEALHALQLSHLSGVSLEAALGAILVVLVAHLKQHGYQRAVSLDDDPILSDANTPGMGRIS